MVPRETAGGGSMDGAGRIGGRRCRAMADLLGLGGGISGAHQRSPFGQLPFRLAGALGGQEQGLLRAFGFGPRGPAQERSLERLLGRGGPLAEFANQVRGFSGTVIPEAQAAGQTVATRGSEAF